MYKIYVARNGLEVYIGYCKSNAKQNFYRNCKNNQWDYKKYEVAVVDKVSSRDMARTIVVANGVLAMIYGFNNINKSIMLQVEKEYNELVKISKGGEND